MRNTLALSSALLCLSIALPTAAVEGMFTPEQLPDIRSDLREAGLKIDPRDLSDLTGFPMGAVVSLGGCSASFVSPQGLVVTNHHCARGSVQYNSTEENNYLRDGFYAETLEAELPAAPGSRIFVTVDFDDVTERVLGDLDAGMSGRDRFDAIDARRKAIIAECEEDAGHRCQVAGFFGGAEYKLIKRLEIKDVRIAYAPADAIGKYGGDIDNWMWPRHTGDFAFYRAYVAPDGSSADYSEDNVPYSPEHTLKVSAGGLEAGDFVMAAGYPGSTQRYTRLAEVENTFDWQYPLFETFLADWIGTIEAAAPEGTDARIKYESRLAGLNNYMKNLGGQIEGARRVGLVDRRRAREAALDAWIAEDADRAAYADAIARVDALAEESASAARQDFWYDQATRSQMLSAAQRLLRLAHEREKPDAERDSGYQERDMDRFRSSMQAMERRFDPAVDRAEWASFVRTYAGRPAEERVAELDAALMLNGGLAGLEQRLKGYYDATTLGDVDTRLKLMEASVAELEAMDDPFMRLAVALHDVEMERIEDGKRRAGESAAARPGYMAAIRAWQAEQGQLAYPDANSTLRITYGSVLGGSPKDGLIYEPFTRLEGILDKHTGEDPFDSPAKQNALIRAEDYGRYASRELGTVPVNFLTDLDSTGGNSGSATLNARGELVGLLFDGTIESVNSDWDFDPRTTRTIHVDTRYMLWVMDKVDEAERLLEEMEIVGR